MSYSKQFETTVWIITFQLDLCTNLNISNLLKDNFERIPFLIAYSHYLDHLIVNSMMLFIGLNFCMLKKGSI